MLSTQFWMILPASAWLTCYSCSVVTSWCVERPDGTATEAQLNQGGCAAAPAAADGALHQQTTANKTVKCFRLPWLAALLHKHARACRKH